MKRIEELQRLIYKDIFFEDKRLVKKKITNTQISCTIYFSTLAEDIYTKGRNRKMLLENED